MGWSNCGTDSKGRDIGYAIEAFCDHPGCAAKIDRGLGYACGEMHGEDEVSCEGYFCEKHLSYVVNQDDKLTRVCHDCGELLKADADSWQYNEEEDTISKKDAL